MFLIVSPVRDGIRSFTIFRENIFSNNLNFLDVSTAIIFAGILKHFRKHGKKIIQLADLLSSCYVVLLSLLSFACLQCSDLCLRSFGMDVILLTT